MDVIKFEDLKQDQVLIIQHWGEMERAIIRFGNNSKLQTFEFLFGKDEGERLWIHYIQKCDRDIRKFMTYLKTEQHNTLLINVLYNESIHSL